MKFFIDTGDVGEIREAHAMGLVDGVTTNPSLIAKSGRKYRDVVVEICEIVNGPISAEVLTTSYDEMMAEAREWHKIHKNIVVKLPLTQDGSRASRPARRRAFAPTLRSASRRTRRCSPPRRARATSRRSSVGSTTSARRAWS